VIAIIIIGENAMSVVKQFFISMYEAIQDMKMYKAQKHVAKYTKGT
jgi:hypothetical protein